MQRQTRPTLGRMITVLFLGGSSLLWHGCNNLTAASQTPPTVTVQVTDMPARTPTSSPTVTPTETATRTPRPTRTPTLDLRLLNPANGHLYLYVRDSKTWHQARDHCAALGGHLVTIEAPSENLFVYNISSDNDLRGIWLGASDEAQEGKWEWVTGEAWKYSNWMKNGRYSKPDNQWGTASSGANYLFLMWDKTWYDVTNGEYPYFVCEWEPASS